MLPKLFGLLRHVIISFKWRIVVTTSALTFVLIAYMAYMWLGYSKDVHAISDEFQGKITTLIAENLDKQLDDALSGLAAEAEIFPHQLLNDSVAARRWLDDRQGIKSVFFDHGLFIVDVATNVMVNSTEVQGISTSPEFKKWVKLAMENDYSVISSPYLITADTPQQTTPHMTVLAIAPLHDAQRNVIGAMVGSFDLSQHELIASIAKKSIGKTGYFYIITSSDGAVVMHKDPTLLLQHDVWPIPRNILEVADLCAKSPITTTDNNGVPVIATFTKLNTTGWILGANYPIDEAYAVTQKQAGKTLSFVVMGFALATLVTWLMTRYFIRPLDLLASHMSSIDVSNSPLETLYVKGGGREIQHVCRCFNDLVLRINNERGHKMLSQSIFENTSEAIVITNAEQCILSVNRTFTHVTGYSHEEVVGKTPRILNSGVHDQAFYESMWEHLKINGNWRGEIVNRRKSGDLYHELLSISTIKNDEGVVEYYVAIFTDVSEIKTTQHQLEKLSHFDSLTQLPNRYYLEKLLKQNAEFCRLNNTILAVLYLDIDDFKAINDSHGHEVGDALLVEFSKRLKSSLRENDIASRVGGDEFVVLLPGLDDIEDCRRVIERILMVLRLSYDNDLNCECGTVSASIGVAVLNGRDGSEEESLLRHANQAMFVTKHQGKGYYHIFDATSDRLALANHEMKERIAWALENNDLLLYYQPKVNMVEGRVVGFEALIRWNKPDFGIVSPGEFMPLIMSSQLDVEIGNWVIEEALAQMDLWRMQGICLPISVNISGHQLQQNGFVETISAALRRFPYVLPEQLELEILETAALEDIHRVIAVINDCKKIGISFALDDFGTGYSSLAYFKRLPIDTVKIDQSFVRDMIHDKDDLAIVEGVVALSQAFKRKVVAEGVETAKHGKMLIAIGCDLAQGYTIAKPMPAHEVPRFLESFTPDSSWKRQELFFGKTVEYVQAA